MTSFPSSTIFSFPKKVKFNGALNLFFYFPIFLVAYLDDDDKTDNDRILYIILEK